MEFREYSNPESADYDIISSLKESSNNAVKADRFEYEFQLMELIGVLEDISEEELMSNYGISLLEYLNPDENVIRKVKARLAENESVGTIKM